MTVLNHLSHRRAGFIISDNMGAGKPERIELIRKYLDKIAACNEKDLMFDDIVVYFHHSETGDNEDKTVSPIFKMAQEREIGIVADTVNANYRVLSIQGYIDNLKRLQDLGVKTVRIDDSSALDAIVVNKMLVPMDGLRFILSSSVDHTPAQKALAQDSDADVKVSTQGYLNGASIEYLKSWFKRFKMNAIDFECYKDGTYMTTAKAITAMGDVVIANNVHRVYVYAHDRNTQFLTRNAAQWTALQTFLAKWHALD